MQSVFEGELSAFSDTYAMTTDELANPEKLSEVTSEALDLDMRDKCTHLYRILVALTGEDEQETEEEVGEQLMEDDRARAAGEIQQREETLDGYRHAVQKHPHFVSKRVLIGPCLHLVEVFN